MAASKLLFLGTGSSSGVPSPLCLVGARQGSMGRGGLTPVVHGCKVRAITARGRGLAREGPAPQRVLRVADASLARVACAGSLSPLRQVCLSCAGRDPRECPNYRCNPSLLLLVRDEKGEEDARHRAVVQIDCCKTFRESMVRWFPEHGVDRLDAVVLTHEHADAIMGLDDVRLMQRTVKLEDYAKQKELVSSTCVWLTEHTWQTVSRVFPYLALANGMGSGLGNANSEAAGRPAVRRRVAQLNFAIMGAAIGEGARPFEPVPGVTMVPLPVWHGADYVCMGFCFGAEHTRVVYLSDISELPAETEELIAVLCPAGIELLIVDALFYTREHNTHFNLPQTLKCVEQLSPRRALCIGMTHDFDQDDVNSELREWGAAHGGIDVQLACDGLAVDGIDLQWHAEGAVRADDAAAAPPEPEWRRALDATRAAAAAVADDQPSALSVQSGVPN